MTGNVLTYLLGNPESSSFDTGKRANPSWFTPDLPVLRSSSQPEVKTYTFAELKAQVKALGSGLRKAGLQDGAQLILFSSDNVEYPLLILGTWAAGGIFVSRRVDYTVAQQAEFIKHVEPKIVIAEAAYIDTATEAVHIAYPSFDSIFEIDEMLLRSPLNDFSRSWKSLLDHTDGPSYAWPRISTREQMESTILIEYTSGSTAQPKGAEHTHRSITSFLEMIPTHATSSAPSRCLSDLAWIGVGAKWFFLESLITRMCSIVYDTPGPFSIVSYLSQASQHSPRVIRMSKRTLDALILRGEDAVKPDFSFVQLITTGSQTIPRKTRLAMKDLCNGRDVLKVVYGSTEVLDLTSTLLGAGSAASSCVGKLKSGIEGKVVDDARNTVGSGEEGKLLFRTPTLMKGYWRDKESTMVSVDADGFFDSGDWGFVDKATDEWHVTGRTKDMIKIKGRTISPIEIEETLLGIPNVGIAVVVWVMNEEGEEMPTAFIVRANEDVNQPKAKDVHAVMQKEMIFLYRITGGLVWLRKSELPYGGNGKVVRQLLKHQAQKMWDEGMLKDGCPTSQ